MPETCLLYMGVGDEKESEQIFKEGPDSHHGRVVQPVEASTVQVGKAWRSRDPAAGLRG